MLRGDFIKDPVTGEFMGSLPGPGHGEGTGGGRTGGDKDGKGSGKTASNNYGLVKGDAEKYYALKSEYAKINDQLLEFVDVDPAGPRATQQLFQLEALVKEMHTLKADPGGPGGIGLPGGARDVLIVGSGPGGLGAAINAAYEGLDTLLVEANLVAGGQAKFSSRVENYGGFPIGVSGKRLTGDMFTQAQRLGAEAQLGVRVTGMTVGEDGMKHVTLSNGETVDARTVIIAGGLEFQKVTFEGGDGPGVFNTDGESLTAAGKGGSVCVLGGSNGAAQAAVGAAKQCDHVYLLSRSPIVKGMSANQIDALKNNPKITIIEDDQVAKLWRDEHGNPQTLETEKGQKIPVKAVGQFFGGVPETKWVPVEIPRERVIDKKTGKERDGRRLRTKTNFETAIAGVYAVGDMRAGGAGRIGVAYGDGQFALREASNFLADQMEAAGLEPLEEKSDAPKKKKTIKEKPSDQIITDIFDLDRANPWFGQTVEPEDTNPVGKQKSRRSK